MTGTLATPLARALLWLDDDEPGVMDNLSIDDGVALESVPKLLVRLRSDPEVLAALVEALHETEWAGPSHNGHAAALLDALFGPKP